MTGKMLIRCSQDFFKFQAFVPQLVDKLDDYFGGNTLSHDTQHNDTQYNSVQYNDTQLNDIHQNGK